MRYANKYYLLPVLVLLVGVICVCSNTPAAALGGLNVTPATTTLSLATGHQEQRSTIRLTNNYAVPIILSFGVAARTNATDRDHAAVGAVSVADANVTLAAGQVYVQTIVLRASQALAPGSAQLDLIVTQAAVSGTNVGVLPELRLPLIVVREDGAVSALGNASVDHHVFGFSAPKSLTVNLSNTGNTITIPRGYVSVNAPGGKLASKGTLNTSQIALSPDGAHSFATPLTKLGAYALPGKYTILVSYGLGGDHPAKTVQTSFIYIAWWHVLLLIGLVALALYAVRHAPSVPSKTRGHVSRPPPKRPAIAGRNAS